MNGIRQSKVKWPTEYRTGLTAAMFKVCQSSPMFEGTGPSKTEGLGNLCRRLATSLWSCVIFTKRVCRWLNNHTTDCLKGQSSAANTYYFTQLMGAIVGLRLTQSVSRALEVPLTAIVFHSDSIDVLRWNRDKGEISSQLLQTEFTKYKCTQIHLNGSMFPPNSIRQTCAPDGLARSKLPGLLLYGGTVLST